jgi:AcrR family transcriptional regulator
METDMTQNGITRPKSDGKRELIVNAALQVMITEGVFGATTRKIATAAGVNVASLHYHFHDKEEILLRVMSGLVSSYRQILAQQFSQPQKLHDRIEGLIRFVHSEVEKAPGEQLVLQEMTLYVLRHPQAAHLAAEKDAEFLALYVEPLRSATDVGPEDEARVTAIANFIYTSIVGIFNQWLATGDTDRMRRSIDNLVLAAQGLARDGLGTGSAG